MKFAGHTEFFTGHICLFLCDLLTPLSFVLDAIVTVIARFSALSLLFGGVVKTELTCASCACFLFTIHFSPAKSYSYFTYHHSGHSQPDTFFRCSQEHTLQMVTAQTMYEYLVFGRLQTEQSVSIATSKERRRLLCATRYRAIV